MSARLGKGPLEVDAATLARVPTLEVEREALPEPPQPHSTMPAVRVPYPTRRAAERVGFTVVSDPHAGSDYTRRNAVRAHVAEGVRRGHVATILPGDLVDGHYDEHGKFECSDVGADEQVDNLLDMLERHRGHVYYLTLGNHCNTFWAKSGVNIGELLEGRAARRGRRDVRYVGARAGRVTLGSSCWSAGVAVEMWHPGGRNPGNVVSKVHERCGRYKRGHEPDVVFVGHWHTFAHTVHSRGIHIVTCPSFQGEGSEFSRSMVGPSCVGGLFAEATPRRAPHLPVGLALEYVPIE